MSSFSLELISMTDLMSRGSAGADAIPAIPAIYVWTIDLTRLERLAPERAVDELARLLRLPQRSFTGRASPYYALSVADAVPGLGADRTRKLAGMLQEGGTDARWMLRYASALQRPLYVGQAGNLKDRCLTHLKTGSVLRSYLNEAGLELRECALAYIALPTALAVGAEDGADASDEPEEFPDLSEARQLDVLEALLQRTMRPLLARKIE